MIDPAFGEAFIHKRAHKVAGATLRPFSLAAWFALDAIDSPLLSRGSRAVELSDVILAAKICAAIEPRAADLRPTWREQIRYAMRKRDEAYLAREAQAFVDYLDDYSALPNFYREIEAEDGRCLSAPWILAKVCGLVRAGVSRAEAWGVPQKDVSPMGAGEAFWMDATFRELEGQRLRFLYDEDEEEMDALPDLDALSDGDLLAMAIEDLGETAALAWFDSRKNSR